MLRYARRPSPNPPVRTIAHVRLHTPTPLGVYESPVFPEPPPPVKSEEVENPPRAQLSGKQLRLVNPGASLPFK